MKILKKLFGGDAKIHVDEIAVTPGVLLGSTVIVESGTNTNGNYIKFGDGTLICTHWVTLTGLNSVAYGSVFRTPAQDWKFPSKFVGYPSVSVYPSSGIDFFWGGNATGGLGNDHAGFSVFRPIAFTNMNITVNLMAIGRWK